MTSIQDGLRSIALGDAKGDLPGLALDACDRIDVLEAALREIVACRNRDDEEPSCEQCYRIARKALEGGA